jgi:hypothetical protein
LCLLSLFDKEHCEGIKPTSTKYGLAEKVERKKGKRKQEGRTGKGELNLCSSVQSSDEKWL